MRKLERMTYYMLKKREPWRCEDRGLTERKLSRLDARTTLKKVDPRPRRNVG